MTQGHLAKNCLQLYLRLGSGLPPDSSSVPNWHYHVDLPLLSGRVDQLALQCPTGERVLEPGYSCDLGLAPVFASLARLR